MCSMILKPSIRTGIACLLFSLAISSFAAELPDSVLTKVKAATSFIQVKLKNGREGSGSGFLIGDDLLVTNAHVMGIQKRGVAQWPARARATFHSGVRGKELTVSLIPVAYDKGQDLAFLRVTWPKRSGFKPPTPLKLAVSKTLRETTSVYIIGYPFGKGLAGAQGNPAVTIGKGSISSFRRDDLGHLEAIQVDGDLNPGNSGGPIILKTGEVVAVSVATIMGTQISFAIPADQVSRLLKTGRVATVTMGKPRKKKGGYGIDVSITTVDPMRRMKKLHFVYWTGPDSSKRIRSKENKWLQYGMKGDTKRKGLQLTEGVGGKWSGKLDGLSLSSGKEIFYQIAHRETGKPVFLVCPVVYKIRAVAEDQTGGGGGDDGGDRPVTGGSGSRHKVGKAAKIIKPTDVPPVKAEKARDKRGRTYTKVESKVQIIQMEKQIIGLAAAPSGKALYAIYAGEPGVKVLNPFTLKQTASIPTPRNPTSIWCDTSRIVVVCQDSKVVTVIDSRRGRPVKAFKIRESDKLIPRTIIGRSPDGGYMVTWKTNDGAWWDIFLFHHYEKNGKSKQIVKGAIDWATYMPDTNMMFAQHNFGGSPSGVPDMFDLRKVKGNQRPQNILYQNKLFGGSASFHRSFSLAFLTHNKKCIVLPTPKTSGDGRGQPWTYVADGSLKRIKLEFPGSALVEVPAKDMFVTLGRSWDPITKRAGGPQVSYIASATGRVLRQVNVTGISGHYNFPTYTYPNWPCVYVPGYEVLLFTERRQRSGQGSKVYRVQCGPVGKGLDQKGDPNVAARNEPPAKARPGKKLSFKPEFKRPANRTVTFKLKNPVEGMTIDKKTGTWTWTPDEAWLGDYDITILAVIDGVEIEVITWTISIE